MEIIAFAQVCVHVHLLLWSVWLSLLTASQQLPSLLVVFYLLLVCCFLLAQTMLRSHPSSWAEPTFSMKREHPAFSCWLKWCFTLTLLREQSQRFLWKESTQLGPKGSQVHFSHCFQVHKYSSLWGLVLEVSVPEWKRKGWRCMSEKRLRSLCSTPGRKQGNTRWAHKSWRTVLAVCAAVFLFGWNVYFAMYTYVPILCTQWLTDPVGFLCHCLSVWLECLLCGHTYPYSAHNSWWTVLAVCATVFLFGRDH